MDLIWITDAQYIDDFRIALTFNDGKKGIADLKKKITEEGKKIYEPLKDEFFFRSFQLDSWTICWENDIDFAPEFLYELAVLKEIKND